MLTDLIAAISPAVLIIIVVYYYDRHKEAPRHIWKLVIMGAVVVLPVSWLEREMLNTYASTFSPSWPFLSSLFTAFFVAGVVEEGGKALVFYRFVYKKPWVNEPFDSIVYAVTISMGFALVENFLYITSDGLSTAFVRAFTAVPAHAMFGVIMGTLFSQSQFKSAPLWRAYVIPALLHGIYDTFAMAQGLTANLLLIGYLMWLVHFAFKKAIRLRNVDYLMS